MTEGWGQPPQQQYQQPSQGWGAPPQGQPQQATVAPPPANEFFGGGGGGPSGPSFKFEFDPQRNAGTGLIGTIVAQQQVPKTQPNNPQQQVGKDGRPLWQLRVTLQTALRNWASVAVPPTIDGPNGQKVPVPPDQDTGLRNVYVWYTLREAVEAAMTAAGVDLSQGLKIGAELGVKVVGQHPNPFGGTAIKDYAAVYRPNGPAGGAPAQPAPSVQQAPPPQQYQQTPPPQQWTAPPAAPQGPPPPQGPPAGYSEEPPF